jgi:hypothetical protein
MINARSQSDQLPPCPTWAGLGSGFLLQLADEPLRRGHLDRELCVLGLHTVDILVQGFDLAGRGVCLREAVQGSLQRTNFLLDDGDRAADQWDAVEPSAD